MKAKYPYLAKYNDTSQYDGVILLMTAPHQGTIMYVPSDTSPGDARYELSVLDALQPANTEIDEYTGSVTFKNDADPVLSP